jgi:hypothetical protein
VLGIGGNSSIRIKSTDDTISLLEDLSTLFDERLDCINQLLLVELFLWLSLGNIDSLYKLVLNRISIRITYICDHLQDWVNLVKAA